MLSTFLGASGAVTAIVVIRRNMSKTSSAPTRKARYGAYGVLGYAAYIALRPFPSLAAGLVWFLASSSAVVCVWTAVEVVRRNRPRLNDDVDSDS